MKTKIFLICFLLLMTFSYGQIQWGNWKPISCYKGIYFKVGVTKYGNKGDFQYSIKFKSIYNKKAHFSYVWTLGGDKGVTSRVTIQENSEISSSGTARFTKSGNSYTEVNVNNVCFGETWSSCGNGREICYAECDNGSPNTPTKCDNKNKSQGGSQSSNKDNSQTDNPDSNKNIINANDSYCSANNKHNGIIIKNEGYARLESTCQNGKVSEEKIFSNGTNKLLAHRIYDLNEKIKELNIYYENGNKKGIVIYNDGKIVSYKENDGHGNFIVKPIPQ